ncbi:PilZ domain-containing protein [Novosphingobium sp. ZN18A2]|uniref:PilZ domain-containing protein n=1 Tax=Novosphingobium sp. ZN18A2 TaxID=3079861 RepID=UPI0030D56699
MLAPEPATDDVGLNGHEAPRIIKVRDAERRTLTSNADIRHKVGVLSKGVMTDISERGCRLEMPSCGGKAGQVVYVEIDGIEPWPGVIRWIEPDALGVEFVNPLYGPVVEHLARTRPSVEV